MCSYDIYLIILFQYAVHNGYNLFNIESVVGWFLFLWLCWSFFFIIIMVVVILCSKLSIMIEHDVRGRDKFSLLISLKDLLIYFTIDEKHV